MLNKIFATMTEKKIQVRMPESLRVSIEAAAERNGRSMNSEIVECLKNGIPDVSEHLLGVNASLTQMYPNEDLKLAFLRLMPACQKALTDEMSVLLSLLQIRAAQVQHLSKMQSELMFTNALPMTPKAEELKLAKVPERLRYSCGVFLFERDEKDVQSLSANLINKRLKSQLTWKNLEKILELANNDPQSNSSAPEESLE